MSKTTSSKSSAAKPAGSPKSSAEKKSPGAGERSGYEDRETFSRSTASPKNEYDKRRATTARGHDDQGGSQQSEARDYDKATEGTHSDQRHARERYGEQSPEQRQDSAKREKPDNLGGQDSRDQSAHDRFSLLGRDGGTGGEARDQAIAPEQRRSAGHPQAGRPEETKASKDDTNWTRQDKGSQPGPAQADTGAGRSSER